MSGGSYQYAYTHVDAMATDERVSGSEASELRWAFGEHLLLVARAMRAVEWVDSHDRSLGDEDAAIREALGWRNDHHEYSSTESEVGQALKHPEGEGWALVHTHVSPIGSVIAVWSRRTP